MGADFPAPCHPRDVAEYAGRATLLRAQPQPAQRENLTLQILREAHRAGRLVDDPLALTRIEHGIPLAAEPIDLVLLAAAVVDRARELAPAVTATLDASAHSRLRGDPPAFARCWTTS